MRTINTELLDQLKSNEYRIAILVVLQIGGTTKRYTTWSDDVWLDNEQYFPRGMKVGTVSYGSSNIVSGVSIDFDDVNRELLVALGELGVDDYPISIIMAALDEYGIIIPDGYATIFSGTFSQWDYRPKTVSIKAVSIFSKFNRTTTRVFSSSCTIKVFKGSQCNYSGAETVCDRTYTQCSAFGNTANFQGFRWLPDLLNKRLDIKGEEQKTK